LKWLQLTRSKLNQGWQCRSVGFTSCKHWWTMARGYKCRQRVNVRLVADPVSCSSFFLPMSAVSLTTTYRGISVTWRFGLLFLSLSLPAVFSWGGCCYDCGLLNFSAHLFPFPPSISLFPSFCTFFFFFFFPQNFTPLSYCSSNTILIFIFYSSYHLFSTHLLWKPPLSLFIFKYYPFFLIVGILISLHASQLISQGPKVNDHLSLQWL
jgi:hypothetical protein